MSLGNNGDNYRRIAMRIDLVLRKLARFLPVKDVCPLRLTCTAWNSKFRLAMRSGCLPLQFRDEERLARYMAIMEMSQFIPYGGYQLKVVHFILMVAHALYPPFFNLVGPSIYYLDIHIGPQLDMTTLRRVIFEWTPNLTRLKLTFCFPDFDTNHDYVAQVAIEDLAGLDLEIRPWAPRPKLQSLVLTTGSHRSQLDKGLVRLVTDLIRSSLHLEELVMQEQLIRWVKGLSGSVVLEVFRDHGCGGFLRQLQLVDLKPVDLLTLVQLSLRSEDPINHLETLKVCMPRMRADGEEQVWGCQSTQLLYEFVATQAPTLKRLSLEAMWTQDRITLPHCARLQELSLCVGGDWTRFTPRFPLGVGLDAGLAANFPLLAYLNLDYYSLRVNLMKKRNYAKVWLSFRQMIPLALAELEQTFPGIVHMDIVIGETNIDLLLPHIFACWNLKSLLVEVIFNDPDCTFNPELTALDLDQVLTGIPMAKFQALRQAIADGAAAVAKQQERLAELKTQPGISDLKELQEFKIRARWGNSGRLVVTPISELFGFKAPGSKLQIWTIG